MIIYMHMLNGMTQWYYHLEMMKIRKLHSNFMMVYLIWAIHIAARSGK